MGHKNARDRSEYEDNEAYEELIDSLKEDGICPKVRPKRVFGITRRARKRAKKNLHHKVRNNLFRAMSVGQVGAYNNAAEKVENVLRQVDSNPQNERQSSD